MDLIAKVSVRSICGRGLFAMALLCFTGLMHAQAVADDAADPPGRVARLSSMSGELEFRPAGANDWTDANLNRPLTTGDRLSTSGASRAELEFGGGSLRMDERSEVGVLDLNDQLAQVELTRGTLNLSVRALDEGQSYEIDTPTVALVIDRPGNFRIDVDGDATRVTAYAGSATVYGDNQARRSVTAGRSYRFGDSALSAVSIDAIANGDAFDDWSRRRDQRYAQSASRQYVDDDVVGYQDLDQYGSWQTSDDYGEVWYPAQVATDWAPYRDGHWAYIAPWGWTWVDAAAWGFAPYHYGRWAYTHRGWGWIPGPRGVRSIYAPALVAFVGGGRWSVGVGGSPVGWFPLGPGDVYNPWYHASHRYFTNVNLHNMRGRHGQDHRAEIDARYNHYRHGTPIPGGHDRDAPRGFTAVSGRNFADGQRVQRDRMRIDPRQLVGLSVLPRGSSQLRPIGRSAKPNGRDRDDHLTRDVVTRHEPPASAINRDRGSAFDAAAMGRMPDRSDGNRRLPGQFGSRTAGAGSPDESMRDPARSRGMLPRPPTFRSATPLRPDERPVSATQDVQRNTNVDRPERWMRSNNLDNRPRGSRPVDMTRIEAHENRPRMQEQRQMPTAPPRFERAPESRMTVMREQPRRTYAPMNNYRPPAPAPRERTSYRPPERAERPASSPQPSRGRVQSPQRSAPSGRMNLDGH